MSVHVPHSPRQRSALALTALTCLLCAAPTTAALAQQPDATPLWKAFPLTQDRPAEAKKPTPRPNGSTLRILELPRSRPATNGDGPGRSGAPATVAFVFYGALGCLAAIGVGAAALHVVRRPPRPVTCEISWSPSEDGDAFLATAQLDGSKERVVARSRRFERRSPEGPGYHAASRQAYEQLLNDLYAEGWQPYERGRHWWEVRLRHELTSKTPAPTRHG